MESKETVCFNEDVECARVVVKEILYMFEASLSKFPEKRRERGYRGQQALYSFLLCGPPPPYHSHIY
ncbi:hypothetical protein Ccrd_017863 [Cynara cardunculus var. scolymus]|uniref:Uncharacterized protein n=1 Tax=Cynara cardunculus var. scolymus TaxID=59895 RepID=A0A118K254_CYNCS|nr:hypothetical protein Ccrd_017863 [Cynara cardunculus var. scolymus]